MDDDNMRLMILTSTKVIAVSCCTGNSCGLWMLRNRSCDGGKVGDR